MVKRNSSEDKPGTVFEKNDIAPPIYSQIALDIAARIARGDIKENTKLTGRSLLATTYAVSPETIRRSMRLLADVGIVDIKSNSGATILSRAKAAEYIDTFNTGRSVRVLKRELKELLNERDAINKKVIEIIDEIIKINEHLKNIDPLQNYEIEVPTTSSLIGKSIEESKFWQNTGATIVAIRRQDQIILSPGPYAVFLPSDTVKYPSELSGGQQQRIGVLRALAASPPIVLMDEPFGALDPITRESLQEEIKNIQRKLNKTIIFVTHDMDEALRLADTIIFMNHGSVVQIASPEEMLQNPAEDIIKSFMGKRMQQTDYDALLASDIMRVNVLKVPKTKYTLECIELMNRKEVNSLVIVDEDQKYLGVVSIDDIRKYGKAGREVGEFINHDTGVVNTGDSAKDAFDSLVNSQSGYVIVKNDDETVAGLITKTSMVKAMAEAMWGEQE